MNSRGMQEVASELWTSLLTVKAKEMHYFSNLFWQRTLHVADRSTVHHQEYLNTVFNRNRYLSCFFCWLSASVVSSILTSLADSEHN